MKLSERNWLVRFAFLGSDWDVPNQTSLCALFWRIVWRLVVAAFLLTVVTAFAVIIYQAPLTAIGTFVFIGILLCAIIGIGELQYRYNAYQRGVEYGELEPSPLVETLHAVKNRVCPIIRIERER